MKKFIDAKSLRPARASIPTTKAPKAKPSLFTPYTFTSQETARLFEELKNDLKFISKRPLSDHYIIEALIHYWYRETAREPRMDIALRIGEARRVANFHRRKEISERKAKDVALLEGIVENLLPKEPTEESSISV